MSTVDGDITVVFNGEIYNHRELRAELEARGHKFVTDHSDTEVLIHGYREWGRDLPRRLNGMFGFAIYHKSEGKLFLSRDRFGKKPLFYCHQNNFFAFASEIPALLLHPSVDRTPDQKGLMKLFAYGVLPAPHTHIQSIKKIPGGHSMEIDLASFATKQWPYWRFSIEPREPGRSVEDLAEELKSLLSQAVHRRLESDVPLGVFLSGGIDSSFVAALAKDNLPQGELDTFSIGFNETSYDESPYARDMAQALGTRHHERICDLSAMQNEAPKILADIGEPFADSSILPTSMLSRFTRETHTVALSGDGGDELFAGYDPFDALGPSQLYQRLIPMPAHRVFQGIANRLPVSSKNMSLDFKVRRWLRGVQFPPALWAPVWMGMLSPEEIGDLFETQVSIEELYEEAFTSWENCPSDDLMDRNMEYFARFYLQDGVLVKIDRASMMSSLEVRSPFLDNDLVEFARCLPSHLKWRRDGRKYLLKLAARGILPDHIIERPKKGLGIPLASWIKALPKPQIDGLPFLRQEWLDTAWDAHLSGKRDYRHALWCCFAIERCFTSSTMAGAAVQPAM